LNNKKDFYNNSFREICFPLGEALFKEALPFNRTIAFFIDFHFSHKYLEEWVREEILPIFFQPG